MANLRVEVSRRLYFLWEASCHSKIAAYNTYNLDGYASTKGPGSCGFRTSVYPAGLSSVNEGMPSIAGPERWPGTEDTSGGLCAKGACFYL